MTRLLTPSGRAVAAATPVLLALGVAANYPELVLLGLAGLLTLLGAFAWMLIRPQIVAVRSIDRLTVTEGEAATASLTLTNVARRRSPPMLASESVGGQSVTMVLPSLRAQDSRTVSYELPTGRRGHYRVGPLRIGFCDPLRLVRIDHEQTSTAMLRVHPRIHDVAPIPTGRTQDTDGPTLISAPHGGIAFHSLREYNRGDDLRLIHWPSTARTGALMVRHNVVPSEPRLLIVLDTSSEPYSGDFFEDAVRVAASLCVAGCDGGFPTEFRTTGGLRVSTDEGEPTEGFLDRLAEVEMSSDDPGVEALLGMLPQDDGVSLGVVTGQADGGSLATVSVVRPRFDMASVVQVGERHERSAMPLRGAVVLNVATSADFAAAWNRLGGRERN